MSNFGSSNIRSGFGIRELATGLKVLKLVILVLRERSHVRLIGLLNCGRLDLANVGRVELLLGRIRVGIVLFDATRNLGTIVVFDIARSLRKILHLNCTRDDIATFRKVPCNTLGNPEKCPTILNNLGDLVDILSDLKGTLFSNSIL